MVTGFTAPSVLFVGASEAPERALFATYFQTLTKRYERLIVPTAGAMSVPQTWVDSGGAAARVEASDVSLYSAVLGSYLAGDDLGLLAVRINSRLLRLPSTPMRAAARILWAQLVARFAHRETPYWAEILQDLNDRQDFHEAEIMAGLVASKRRVGGLTYRSLDMWEHVREHLDDPSAVIHVDPPQSAALYEKFYDTKGSLTWTEPDHLSYDPATGVRDLLEMSEKAKALVIVAEVRPPGKASGPSPVYARNAVAGENWYVHTNRPDELLAATHGPVVKPRVLSDLEKYGANVIPGDHPISHKSKLQIVPVGANVVQYYKDLWMHRLRSAAGGNNFLVLVDGFVAGCGGYSLDPIMRKFPGTANTPGVLIRFAPGAPHNSYRLGRLVTKVAMQERTLLSVLSPTEVMWLSTVDDVVTANFTQYPEHKTMRGLMKLESKVKDRDGYKLIYRAPIEHETEKQLLTWWIQKEDQWLRRQAK